jgi:prepilin-type N-terminal cleavage/methylation domain-containing protein/prepilin-type processing-associated H-X9-DG protein
MDRAGFTLIELLVTLSLVALLIVLGLAGIQTARRQADRGAALTNLRQIGTALLVYAGDHDQFLPGPLWPGQVPAFDRTRTGRLPVELADYLEIDSQAQPFIVKLFVPPAYRRLLRPGHRLEDDRTFVMNMKVTTGTETLNPWGSLATGQGTPQRLSQISRPALSWALSDADQQHPDVVGAPWRSATPVEPIHGRGRTALFFDGHADWMELTAFLPPP